MILKDEDLSKLAGLSKIHIDAEDREILRKDISQILTHIDKLIKVDVRDTEPLVHLVKHQHNVTREDVVEESLSAQKVLKNAQEKDTNYFKIPKLNTHL